MITNPPLTFEYFNSITIKHFIENYDNIIKNIEKNIDKHNEFYFLNIYDMKDKLDYIGIKKNINDLYKNIIEVN